MDSEKQKKMIKENRNRLINTKYQLVVARVGGQTE